MPRNYSNSLSGMAGTSSASRCPECSNPRCEGENKLRIFENWNDLSAHLDEDTIVRSVNRLVEIGLEYMLLKNAEEKRQTTRHAHAEERAFLLSIARRLTPQQVVEAMGEVRPQIVTMRMKSRQGGQ